MCCRLICIDVIIHIFLKLFILTIPGHFHPNPYSLSLSFSLYACTLYICLSLYICRSMEMALAAFSLHSPEVIRQSNMRLVDLTRKMGMICVASNKDDVCVCTLFPKE
jgi:hypothetical protein